MQIPSAPPSPVSSSGKLVSSRLQSWATARGHSVATHQSHLRQNRSQTMRQSSLGSAKEASSISGLSQRCCKRFRSSSSSPRFWGSCSSPWWKWGAGYRTPANEYIWHICNLDCGFGNRRPTGEAKTHVLGTFYFWNNLPTTLCVNGLTLRMMQKHHQKILHRSIFLIYWYLEGFQHLECGFFMFLREQ